MAKEKDISEQLADAVIGETVQVSQASLLRVPGGFVAVIGNTSAFVPLNDVGCAELGIEFKTEE